MDVAQEFHNSCGIHHTMKKSKKKRKVIAFLFSSSSDRKIDLYKSGALQYARPTKDWAFIQCDQNNIERDLQRTDGLFDGGIGGFGIPDLWAAARKASYPVINLHGGHGFGGLPKVGVDHREIGRVAAHHLMEQGYKQFSFFGLKSRGFSLGRWAGYVNELRRHGFRPSRFMHFKRYPALRVTPMLFLWNERSIAGWLKSLPKPCGIFCCDDLRAEWISLECQNLGLRIPDDIAILGVDDNEVRCVSAVPHLSSIQLPFRQVGFEAARLLDRIMERGAKGPIPTVMFPPEKVVCRNSTDLVAVDNPQLVKALKYIRANAHTGNLSIPDVVAQTSYCRRILEIKFRQAFGRTIFYEIRRLQVEQAKKLLRETDQTMNSVADAAGWGSASHFGVEFKKLTGLSPGDYRKRMR